MFNIGWHLSASEGFFGMGKTAFENGASTFAFFTRNPRGGQAKPLDKEDALKLNDFLKEISIPVFPISFILLDVLRLM